MIDSDTIDIVKNQAAYHFTNLLFYYNRLVDLLINLY